MQETNLRMELMRDEGSRLVSYQDSVGLWTIGIGHLLGPTRRMESITQSESYALFDMDIENAKGVLDRWIPEWGMIFDEVRQRALINMAFNLGDRIQQFVTTRRCLLSKNWHEAAVAMLHSKWAGQVGDRAQRIAHMIEFGEVQ